MTDQNKQFPDGFNNEQFLSNVHVTYPSIYVPIAKSTCVCYIGTSQGQTQLLEFLKNAKTQKNIVLYSLDTGLAENIHDQLSWLIAVSNLCDAAIVDIEPNANLNEYWFMFALSNLSKKDWYWCLQTNTFSHTINKFQTLELLVNKFNPNAVAENIISAIQTILDK